MKLLDTTVFGDILDGRENVRDRLLQHAPAEFLRSCAASSSSERHECPTAMGHGLPWSRCSRRFR